jgi:hypothetical protein
MNVESMDKLSSTPLRNMTFNAAILGKLYHHTVHYLNMYLPKSV